MFRILVAHPFAEASQVKEITEADAVIGLEVLNMPFKSLYGVSTGMIPVRVTKGDEFFPFCFDIIPPPERFYLLNVSLCL